MSSQSPHPDSNRPDLEMKIDLNILEHLGLKMYTSLPAVISEYVANAWDAFATEVDIQIPDNPMSEDYEITIADDGNGMTVDDVNEKFLVVGRNRRQDEGKDTVSKDGHERKVMGRKGIGKLAGFGVAGVVNVWTCRGGDYVEFELDYDEMRKRAAADPSVKTNYHPEVLDSGSLENESNCTVVTLKKLKRERKPNPHYVRQKLARRFGVIGENFRVVVNDEQIQVTERNLKKRCQFIKEFDNETVDEQGKYQIKGWIGTLKTQVPDEIGNGVVVLTRGKLVQEPSTFGVGQGGSTAQQALQYLVGEIRADFLDQEDTDLIATNRSRVVWEKPPASHLQEFLNEEISTFCGRWPSMRSKEKMKEVRETDPYERYIEPLDKWEQDLADEFLGKLSKGEGYDDEMLEEMASYVSSGVQQKTFSHLLRDIEESDVADAQQLLELFDKYEVLDAMNSLKVVKGRVKALEKFDKLVKTNAKEVPTLHDFIGDNPWLLDPHWDYLNDEVTFRQLLKEQFPDQELEEKNRRIDFVCLGDNNTLKIIEIKRPDVTIGINELEQLKNYVDFARDFHGEEPVGNRKVEGYIIGKKLADSNRAESEYNRMENDNMYYRTYQDLRRLARQSHREFVQVLERKAERTESDMLQLELEELDTPEIDESNEIGEVI